MIHAEAMKSHDKHSKSVDLDMKEKDVRSVNLEQVRHAISRIRQEHIHPPHTTVRPDLSCRKALGRAPSSSRPPKLEDTECTRSLYMFVIQHDTFAGDILLATSSIMSKFTEFTALAMTFHCILLKIYTSYNFFYHVKVYRTYCVRHDFSLRPHDIGVIEWHLQKLGV